MLGNMSTPMTNVSSSNVAQIGHDSDQDKLLVLFNNGSLYSYSNVSKNEFDNLLGAASVGGHLARHIKGVKPFSRIS